MAYAVHVTLPERPLGRADVIFDVKQDNAVLGKLEISQGAIEWIRKGGGKRNTYKLNWADFDALMKEYGQQPR